MSIGHIKKKHIEFIMKSMPKKLKLSTDCSQDNPVLKLKSASNDRLLKSFYTRNSDILAKKLLGKILCRRDLVPNETKNKVTSNSIILKARIVETEMYPGVQDPASHSFQGKKTSRNGAMFMDPGVCYVYNIYGMYQCKFNKILNCGEKSDA